MMSMMMMMMTLDFHMHYIYLYNNNDKQLYMLMNKYVFDHNLIMNDLNVIDHPLDQLHVYLLLNNSLEHARGRRRKNK